jgi:hypothetical protein
MASHALPHKTGGYRAYKSIAGRVFQYYSRDPEEANRVQAKYESLAALSTKSPFSKCGRLLGVRFAVYRRTGRQPQIIVRVQIGPFRNQKTKQWNYKGKFEDNWKRMRQIWAEWHDIQKIDLTQYQKDLRQAKKIYIQDVGELEDRLKTEKESAFVKG